MANYVVLANVTFAAQANATNLYNQAKALAVNASVARIGQPGERTSFCGVYTEAADGTLTPVTQWYIDRFGIVREGQPAPDNQIPAWVQPTGSQDAYPITDVLGNPTQVTYNGSTWQNTTAANTYAPGTYGWTKV